MKILHLLGAYDDSGGILSVIRNLQETTRARGWTHSVWVHRSYRETRQPALEYRYSRWLCGDSPHHWMMLGRAMCAWLELKALLRRESFDVVHAHSRGALVVGLIIAAGGRRPILFTNHGLARRIALYRWAARRPNMYTVVLTPQMARYYGLTAPPPKITTISACCADRFFTAEPVKAEPGLAGRPLRLVGMGNIVRWKNWHLVLEALAQLNERDRVRIRFDHWGPVPVIGDSAGYAADLQRQVEASGLQRQVTFHGPITWVEACLRQADWFVLPSTNEPCSVALIEAMALGLPVLVSASGGNVDIVADGKTGLFFAPDQSRALAEKLRMLLAQPGRLLAPEAIRESVRLRSAASVAEQYSALYQRLRPAGGRRGGPRADTDSPCQDSSFSQGFPAR